MFITVAAIENTQSASLVTAEAAPLPHAPAVVLKLRFRLAVEFAEANALPLTGTRTVTLAVQLTICDVIPSSEFLERDSVQYSRFILVLVLCAWSSSIRLIWRNEVHNLALGPPPTLGTAVAPPFQHLTFLFKWPGAIAHSQ